MANTTGGTLIQEGEQLDYTPGADIAAGTLVVLNELVAFAPVPIPNGQLGAIETEVVCELPCAAVAASTIGALVYQNTSTGVISTVGVSTNRKIGVLAADKANNATTLRVKLIQGLGLVP